MRSSRLLAFCLVAFTLAGCDALLGLDKYSEPQCYDGPGGDCDAATRDAPAEAHADGGMDADATSDADATVDAHDADASSDADAAPFSDVSIDVPLNLVWAQWAMPNPDASIGGDSSTLLPNPMSYADLPQDDAGSDAQAEGGEDASEAGSPYTVDQVTKLVWEKSGSTTPMGLTDAIDHCAMQLVLGQPMRLPTRIELVSLIDFTRTPTIDSTVFSAMPSPYWTSSSYPLPDAGPESWFVYFNDGTVSHTPQPPGGTAYVRCVWGGGS
jgi:hypothetical protein